MPTMLRERGWWAQPTLHQANTAMKFTADVVEACRRQFPALSRSVGDFPAAFLDGPGGTQVPQRVIEAISHYLGHTNANHGGLFATSRESDALLDLGREPRRALESSCSRCVA